ncbi:PIN domain-containing protein [Micromonospora chalcea]|uniref:PIN domain-containing protein n=1 Tax=Micromonospora chalcea TaxID=1874 RepID=UPI003F4A5D0F
MRFQPGIRLVDAEEALAHVEACWDEVMNTTRLYHDAVAESVPLLREVFLEPDLAAGMLSNAYWHLLQMTDTVGASVLAEVSLKSIQAKNAKRALTNATSMEVGRQVNALSRARTELNALKVLADRPGLPVVIDTNMLISWKSPDQIDWRETLRAQGETIAKARIIVPLRVVDELDRQKSGDGKHLPARAAVAIRYLERTFSGRTVGEPVPLRDGSTVEIWTATDERGPDPDLIILRCAADIAALHPRTGVRVLTGDFGMRLRAVQMGLPVLRVPADRFRKDKPAINGCE